MDGAPSDGKYADIVPTRGTVDIVVGIVDDGTDDCSAFVGFDGGTDGAVETDGIVGTDDGTDAGGGASNGAAEVGGGAGDGTEVDVC